jgi:hypothetical protein
MRAAQLLEQRAVFALEPFLDRFVFGSFPEPLLDHFVGGHVGPPTQVRPARYAKPGSALFKWGGSVAPARKTQLDRPDDQRMLDPSRRGTTPWIRE